MPMGQVVSWFGLGNCREPILNVVLERRLILMFRRPWNDSGRQRRLAPGWRPVSRRTQLPGSWRLHSRRLHSRQQSRPPPLYLRSAASRALPSRPWCVSPRQRRKASPYFFITTMLLLQCYSIIMNESDGHADAPLEIQHVVYWYRTAWALCWLARWAALCTCRSRPRRRLKRSSRASSAASELPSMTCKARCVAGCTAEIIARL